MQYVVPPSIAGLCLQLGIDRSTWQNYADPALHPELADVAAEARARIEAYLEQELLTREKGLQGIIFNLQNNYGWRQKQEVELGEKTRSSMGPVRCALQTSWRCWPRNATRCWRRSEKTMAKKQTQKELDLKVECALWFRNLRETNNRTFLPLFWDEHRYLVLKGGGGSGKSIFAGRKILERAITEPGHRFLVCRKVARTLRESCFKQLLGQLIDFYPDSGYKANKSDLAISFRNGARSSSRAWTTSRS